MSVTIEKYQALPFEYGLDCCTFAGEMLEELGRYNPMRELSYKDETEAYAIIDSHGSLGAAISHYFGQPTTEPPAVGDVGICAYRGRYIAGVVQFVSCELRIVVRTYRGLVDWPLSRIDKRWRTDARRR